MYHQKKKIPKRNSIDGDIIVGEGAEDSEQQKKCASLLHVGSVLSEIASRFLSQDRGT